MDCKKRKNKAGVKNSANATLLYRTMMASTLASNTLMHLHYYTVCTLLWGSFKFNNSWTEHNMDTKITSINFSCWGAEGSRSSWWQTLGNQLIDHSPYIRHNKCKCSLLYYLSALIVNESEVNACIYSIVRFVHSRWTRDARALHWRPERRLPLFCIRVVLLSFFIPVLIVPVLLRVHPYLKWSQKNFLQYRYVLVYMEPMVMDHVLLFGTVHQFD